VTTSPADLARNHLARFERNGRSEDLDRALDAARLALAVTPEGHPKHVAMLSLLGSASIAAYEATEDRQRLREAVDVLGRAERLSVEDGHLHAVVVADLAAAQVGTARRSGRLDDLRESVVTARRAVRLMEIAGRGRGDRPGQAPDGHVGDRPASALGNLASALLVGYQWSDDLDALQEAVETGRWAVALTSESDRWALLVNLSTAERAYHERVWDPEALQAAIRHASEAADIEGSRHDPAAPRPGLAMAFHALGEALETAAGAIVGPDAAPAFDEAASAFRRAARAENGPTKIRAQSAASWGRLAALGERYEEAADALVLAIDLLEAAVEEPRHDSDRQHRLLPFTGLACDAAACAARLGRHDEAVRLLERGRGVLIARALDLPGAPELAGDSVPGPDLPGQHGTDPLERVADGGGTRRVVIVNTSAYFPHASIVTIDGTGPGTGGVGRASGTSRCPTSNCPISERRSTSSRAPWTPTGRS
jgi:tetratricopeptide (TPR) repeat protein